MHSGHAQAARGCSTASTKFRHGVGETRVTKLGPTVLERASFRAQYRIDQVRPAVVEIEPWLSELSELSDTPVGLSDTVGHCRTVGLSDCRSIFGLSDTLSIVRAIPYCRTLSDAVRLSACRTVGLSDCRTSSGLSDICQRLSRIYCDHVRCSVKHCLGCQMVSSTSSTARDSSTVLTAPHSP